MIYRLGDISIDTGRQLVSRVGDPIPLPKLSYDLFLVLVRGAPNVISPDELMRLVWQGIVVSPETISQRVKLLRDALDDDPRVPRYIAGLRGRGYQIVAPVKEIDDNPASTANSISTPGTSAITSESAPATASGPVRVAICVLSFINLSGDVEQQAFSDGISEDIITELSRWRLLEVRSRSASFKYRGTSVDIPRVARELNVRFVVEGSVRRMGDRIRITVQLIDAASGQQVWGERFDRGQSETFAVQDEVVQRIVSTLVGRVQSTDADRARRKHPASLEAYECVLKGNALPWDDTGGAAEAARLFGKAIEVDPGYGLAHALLANLVMRDWQQQPEDSTGKLNEAYRLAMRATELDDAESTCHSILAQVSLYRRAFELALQHMRRAVELNPNNQWNAADMALVLGYAGEAEQALIWSARAKQIDPYFDPPWYWRVVGRIHMNLRRYPEALVMFGHIPLRNYRDAAYMAGCHARLGESERARALVADCLAKRPEFYIRHFVAKEPFRLVSDAGHLGQSLHLAGLPE
jgi:TolB-like protein